VWNSIMTVVKIVVETVASVITGAFRIIEGIFQVFTALLSGDWDLFWQGIHNVVDGILTIIGGIIGGFIGMFENIIKTGLGIIDGIFKAFFGDGPDSIYANIVGFINTIIGFAGDIIDGLVGGIGDAIGPAIKSITGFVGDIVDGIKDFLGIKSPAKAMLSIGKNIVQGLWKGINDARNWIANKVWNFIRSVIPGPILNALGMHSPSRVMMGIGTNIVKGLAIGIESSKAATDAMLEQADSISGALNGVANSAVDAGSFTGKFSTDANRSIDLNVNVTSGDGSVNGLDMNTLAGLITGSDMVRALERMSTVD
jgi:phage-related protein